MNSLHYGFLLLGSCILIISTMHAAKFDLKNNYNEAINLRVLRTTDDSSITMKSYPFKIEPNENISLNTQDVNFTEDAIFSQPKPSGEYKKHIPSNTWKKKKLSGIEITYGPGFSTREVFSFKDNINDTTNYYLKFTPGTLSAQKGTILTRSKLKNNIQNVQILPAVK